MMGGTFTYPSPIFARLIHGVPPPQPYISRLVEKALSHGIFGMEWQNIHAPDVAICIQHYNIDNIIVEKKKAGLVQFCSKHYNLVRRFRDYFVFDTGAGSKDFINENEENRILEYSVLGNMVMLKGQQQEVTIVHLPYFPWIKCTMNGQFIPCEGNEFGTITLSEPLKIEGNLSIDYSIPPLFRILLWLSVLSIICGCGLPMILLVRGKGGPS